MSSTAGEQKFKEPHLFFGGVFSAEFQALLWGRRRHAHYPLLLPALYASRSMRGWLAQPSGLVTY